MNSRAIKQIKENTKIGEEILFKLVDRSKPGVTTSSLNQIAKQEFKRYNAIPAAKFLNSKYHLSIAINKEVLFGEISKNKKINNGDVIKFALGVFKNGYFSDLGYTFIVGETTKDKKI